MFEKFQNFLPRAANRYGISKELEAATTCQKFRALIPEMFAGKPEAQESISPLHFKEGVLTVHVKNNAWAQEVMMRKHKIIDEMNARIGENKVKNLRVTI